MSKLSKRRMVRIEKELKLAENALAYANDRLLAVKVALEIDKKSKC